VLQWISSRPAVSLYTTSITQAEILNGVLALPAGRRRRNIETAADTMFKEEFSGRILAFDSAAARRYAELVNDRRRRGRPISQFGAQIAAIFATPPTPAQSAVRLLGSTRLMRRLSS
jgi:predicted nucleic acid-binding protein